MSFELVRQQLITALRTHGSAIAADSVLLQRVLASTAVAYPREVGLIVSAAKAGVPAAIEFAGAAATDLRTKMAQKLANDLGCSPDDADQTIATWISALESVPSAPAVSSAPPVAATPSEPPVASKPPSAPAPPSAPPASTAPQAASSPPPAQAGPSVYVPSGPRAYSAPPSMGGSNKKALTITLASVGAVLVIGGIVLAIVLGTRKGGGGGMGGTTTTGLTGGNMGGGGVTGDVAGNYKLDFDATGVAADKLQGMNADQARQAYLQGTSGSLNVGGDLSFTCTYGDQSGTLQITGKLLQAGPSYVGQNTSVKSNNQEIDKTAIVVELVPVGGGKLELRGSIYDSMQRVLPGMKILYVR